MKILKEKLIVPKGCPLNLLENLRFVRAKTEEKQEMADWPEELSARWAEGDAHGVMVNAPLEKVPALREEEEEADVVS
ncbi:uncharacterized protein N7496_010247 [Penicillium cataractarum]|uniref:Uncharacterized protein n=1 Tax=Penicillium cataractarum TaxID=2100454 RepID=A0A9W9RT52_9EURO|nr:uncharacterized protein N7496_010247 [Penicillium cataractarum]KAJ5364534.1 hypothetical protein N7496_010247 [Penicillium cataractarum]